jgi:hypothetical protein
LALFEIDLHTSFERKQQTTAVFIAISGAFDNVLSTILCDNLRKKEVLSGREIYCLLWRKELVFFVGGRECLTLVGYKGLQQGLVPSLFLFNVIGSCVDRFIPSGCGFFQYPDDLVVYMAHRLFDVALGLIQTACTSLNILFLLWA